MSDYFRTQYEQCYAGSDYYWGLEPAAFLDDLIAAAERSPGELAVLDIGCGEGKDAVYLAGRGCRVTAFDLTEAGIRKAKRLAAERGVPINAFTADINDFEPEGSFDIVYSTGTIQYLFDENIPGFFEKVNRLTADNGIAYFNVFVEKPFLELPPDWDREEKMWKTGQLFQYFADWKILSLKEVIFEDNSGGVKHYHCMDTVMAQKLPQSVIPT